VSDGRHAVTLIHIHIHIHMPSSTGVVVRVFVTGASGWVGSAVVPELIAAGHQVVGLARSPASAAALIGVGAAACLGTLDDLEVLRAAAAGADGVIHLAYRHDIAFSGATRTWQPDPTCARSGRWAQSSRSPADFSSSQLVWPDFLRAGSRPSWTWQHPTDREGSVQSLRR
jgi:D-arabinose 1-dehydrogenase-like Zn-dependent alcohol dehydrogenase